MTDGGLQAERTAMAWQRTALATGAASALLLHAADGVLAALPGLLGLGVAVTMLVSAELGRARAVRRLRDGTSASDPRLLLTAAAAALLLALAALALLLTGGLSGPDAGPDADPAAGHAAVGVPE